MSSQVIGALFAAIVLQNTDAFTFYCIMTSICLLASLFFLFLQPVEPEQQNQDSSYDVEPEESTSSAMEDIKQTFAMFSDKRIATLYPLIFSTALNLAILSSVFIKMMVATMDDRTDWSDQDKDSNALLVMIALGVGEILGSLVFGKITDTFTTKNTIKVNMLACTVGYAFIILYGAIYDFKYYLGILMTFSWGV